MEARRPLHYHRNTVMVPRLGAKSMARQVKRPLEAVTDDNTRPQDTSPKVCSTMQCPRCRGEQTEWRATCRRCGACFYCGLVGGGKYQCQICGNHIPQDDREPPSDRLIRVV
jgi:hypothetical protein